MTGIYGRSVKAEFAGDRAPWTRISTLIAALLVAAVFVAVVSIAIAAVNAWVI